MERKQQSVCQVKKGHAQDRRGLKATVTSDKMKGTLSLEKALTWNCVNESISGVNQMENQRENEIVYTKLLLVLVKGYKKKNKNGNLTFSLMIKESRVYCKQ